MSITINKIFETFILDVRSGNISLTGTCSASNCLRGVCKTDQFYQLQLPPNRMVDLTCVVSIPSHAATYRDVV